MLSESESANRLHLLPIDHHPDGNSNRVKSMIGPPGLLLIWARASPQGPVGSGRGPLCWFCLSCPGGPRGGTSRTCMELTHRLARCHVRLLKEFHEDCRADSLSGSHASFPLGDFYKSPSFSGLDFLCESIR